MATEQKNAVKYGIISGDGMKKVHVPVNHASFPIKQGELVYLDTSAHIAKALDSDAHALTKLGVALQPSAINPAIDSSSEPAIMVGWDCVAQLKTTAADVFYPGADVYLGADAQTVTVVVGTNKIGNVVLPVGVASVTGATGVFVDVLLKSSVY